MTHLPLWANNAEGFLLAQAIIAEQPFISLATERLPKNEQRYAGKNAAKLRELFDRRYLSDAMDWCADARPNQELYDERHDEVAAYIRTDGPEALIERLLDAGSLAPVVRLGSHRIAA